MKLTQETVTEMLKQLKMQSWPTELHKELAENVLSDWLRMREALEQIQECDDVEGFVHGYRATLHRVLDIANQALADPDEEGHGQ